MKIATLNDGTRDGKLLLVSRDLKTAMKVGSVAPTFQYALDNWSNVSGKLRELYNLLNEGRAPESFEFKQEEAHSPLPRAYQWADGSAYVNHVELVRKARGAEMPENFWHDPLMYQGGSDDFIPPRGDVRVLDPSWGIDFESEIAVITGDTPMGVSQEEAGKHILFFMLVNDVSLRGLIPGELKKSFGFFQSKPASSFSPVAVTPDELGDAFDGTKINLPLVTHYRGELFGRPNAGVDMTFGFPRLVSHAAKSRNLGAGCIIGSGTISNYDRSNGSSCLAERRMLEIVEHGEAKTPFMKEGDTVRIEMFNDAGDSIFGSIDQKVVIG